MNTYKLKPVFHIKQSTTIYFKPLLCWKCFNWQAYALQITNRILRYPIILVLCSSWFVFVEQNQAGNYPFFTMRFFVWLFLLCGLPSLRPGLTLESKYKFTLAGSYASVTGSQISHAIFSNLKMIISWYKTSTFYVIVIW